MVELCLHFPIRLYGILLNQLSTGTILPFTLYQPLFKYGTHPTVTELTAAEKLFLYILCIFLGGPDSNPGLVMWDFVMDRSGAAAGFLRELRFPLPIYEYIPSASPQSSSLSPEAGTIGQE
jgi:hypothetical protein